MAQSLVDHCTSPQTKREVSQTASDALNSINGRPVSGSDELLVVAGGPYFQHAADYLVKNAVAPIGSRATQTTFELYDTKTGALVASEPISSVSDSHGLFAVQFVREPSSSSLILNAYGFTIGGTAAATFYVAQVLAPNLAAASKAWYVGEWVDANADLKPDANELTILASGK